MLGHLQTHRHTDTRTDRQSRTDFSMYKWLRVDALRLRVPAALEVLDCWNLLWKIDLYMCNICSI